MERHPPEIVLPLLERIREENSGSPVFPQTYRYLEPGDTMLKCVSTNPYSLLIDTHPLLSEIAKNPRPLRAIYDLFPNRTSDKPYGEHNDFYKHNSFEHSGLQVTRLSDLIDAQRGECLEFSAVSQLVAQEKGLDIRTLSGHILKKDSYLEPHTFNIMQKESGLYIIDIGQNVRTAITGVLQRDDNSLQIETEKDIAFDYFLN